MLRLKRFSLLGLRLNTIPLIFLQSSILFFCLEGIESLINLFRIKVIVNANSDNLVIIYTPDVLSCILLLFVDKLQLFIVEFDHFFIRCWIIVIIAWFSGLPLVS